MALAMGALVLVFSAILGFLVLQNRENTSNTTVSQLSDQEQSKAAPSYAGEVPSDQANAANRAMATNTMSNSVSNTTAANSVAPAQPATSGISPDKAPTGVGGASTTTDGTTSNSREVKELPLAGRNEKLDELALGAGKPAAAPPPEDKPVVNRKEKEKDDATKKLAMSEEDRKGQRNDTFNRDTANAPLSKTGPNRAAATGPKQVQQQQNVLTDGVVVNTRSVGGKHFALRSGAWYDSAYHGQPTSNVRRDTGDYEKLDKGLRSISDSLGGVVVVVWRSKAYRIQ
jgi:hypothetical protein